MKIFSVKTATLKTLLLIFKRFFLECYTILVTIKKCNFSVYSVLKIDYNMVQYFNMINNQPN